MILLNDGQENDEQVEGVLITRLFNNGVEKQT